MGYFSYVVARDYGFAPNPFNGYCTLATCKPQIRKFGGIDDWVIGTGAVAIKRQNHVIFAMRITEKLTFGDYWNDSRFQVKKPAMNGSLKKMYGDNIYHREGGNWIQADSHHSLADGATNALNLERDTSVDAVLVSDDFYYFGRNSIPLPTHLIARIAKTGRGHRRPDDLYGTELTTYLRANFRPGYGGDPVQFENFKHYGGER